MSKPILAASSAILISLLVVPLWKMAYPETRIFAPIIITIHLCVIAVVHQLTKKP